MTLEIWQEVEGVRSSLWPFMGSNIIMKDTKDANSTFIIAFLYFLGMLSLLFTAVFLSLFINLDKMLRPFRFYILFRITTHPRNCFWCMRNTLCKKNFFPCFNIYEIYFFSKRKIITFRIHQIFRVWRPCK